MNIALPALIVFAIFLPGIVYRRHATLAGRFRRERSLGDEAMEAAVATAAVHLPLVAAVQAVHPFGLRVDLAALFQLLASKPSAAAGESASARLDAVVGHPLAVGTYFLAACLLARVAARISRSWVLSGESPGQPLPRQFRDEPGARRWAEWEGLFTPECERDVPADRLRRFVSLAAGRPDDVPRMEVVALVAVVVEFGREPFLYTGLLEAVRFAEDGELERIELVNAYRRALKSEPTPEEQRTQPPRQLRDDPLEGFYRINGRRLILRADEFKTMNLDYFGVEVVDEPAIQPTSAGIKLAA